MAVDKTIKIKVDTTKAVSELKEIKSQTDITFTELRKTTQVKIDGGKAKSSLKDIKKEANKSVKGFDELSQSAKNVGTSAEQSVGGVAKLRLSVQALGGALKAIGIGLIIAALVKLQEALSKNQKVVDAVNVAFETISITFQQLVGTVVEKGEKLFKWFEKIGKVVKDFVSKDIDGLTSAYEEQGEQVETIIQKNRRLAKELVALRNEVKLAEAEQRKLQFTYLKEAEIQRQVRDDVSKTIDERIEANNKLRKVLDKQFAEEKKLAEQKVKLAEKELANNQDNIDLQVALTNAQTELIDLEERITGQRSEMLVNEVSLNDERIANMQELSSIGKSEIDKQLNDLTVQAEQQRELAKRTISDEQQLADTLVKIDEEEKREKQKIFDEQEQALKDQKAEEEKIRNEAINEVRNATMEQRQIELNNAEDKYQKLLALATKYGEDTTELTKQYNQQVADINAKFDDEEIANQKAIQDEKFALAMERVDQAQEIMGAISEIAQQTLIAEKNELQKQLDAGLISQEQFDKESAKIEAEAVKREKKNAMLQVLIDSAQGVAGAIKAGAGLGFPANLGAIATGIIAVLSGIAQAKAILNQVPGGSAGGGTDTDVSTPQQGGGLSGLIPQFENIAPPEPTNNQPVQAFVVETDISNAQALQEELDIQSTL